MLSHWSWPLQERKLAQETLDEAKRAALEPGAGPGAGTGTAQPGLTGSSATTMEDEGVVHERPRKKGRIGAGAAGQGLVTHGVSAKVQEQGDKKKKAEQAKLDEIEKAEQAKREQVAKVTDVLHNQSHLFSWMQ